MAISIVSAVRFFWPALHYHMQETPRPSEYEKYSWTQSLGVNELFASKIAGSWKPGDRNWAHDYHLLELLGLSRERLPKAEIGFYLHMPFTSSGIFRCLVPRDKLLNGTLDADLVEFQADEYCDHFDHSCSRLRNLETSTDGVHFKCRFVSVTSTPMGIDSPSLNAIREFTEYEGKGGGKVSIVTTTNPISTSA